MTVTSRNLQVITGRAARDGARERVYFGQKPIAATLELKISGQGSPALRAPARGQARAAALPQSVTLGVVQLLNASDIKGLACMML
jgi:hypothetical protein